MAEVERRKVLQRDLIIEKERSRNYLVQFQQEKMENAQLRERLGGLEYASQSKNNVSVSLHA